MENRTFVSVVWSKSVLTIEYLQPLERAGAECCEKRGLAIPVETVPDDLSIKCNHLLFVGGESKGMDADLWKDGVVSGLVLKRKGDNRSIVVSMKHETYGAVKSKAIPVGGDAPIRTDDRVIEGITKTAFAIVDGARKEDADRS